MSKLPSPLYAALFASLCVIGVGVFAYLRLGNRAGALAIVLGIIAGIQAIRMMPWWRGHAADDVPYDVAPPV